MENSWHRKCGSIWQSPQGLQNQIFNGSLYIHPSALVKPTSPPLHSGLIPEAVNHWSPILNSNNVGLTEPGSSFLSLLSGPSSMSPNQVLISASHASGCAARSEVSLLSSGPFPQNLGGRNEEVGVDLGWCVSSKPRISANQGGNSVTHVLLQGSHRDSQQLEFPKADAHSKLSSNETLTNFSCPRVGYVDDATASNVHKIHTGTTVGVSHRNPWKTDYSVSFLPSSLLTGCPRVFCLGLSGDLLLSNSGLLGVVCSCHGVHMSVAKFSGHSGSCNVNPGNAVHVDGGETIAQWRKACFRKYGIRIPEDHCGWDWPQGLSVTSGLLQHGPTRASLSGDSEFCNKASSFGASVHSLNQLSHILPPKNAQTVKTVGEFVHRGKHRSTQEDSSILFNGLSNCTNNSSHFLVDDQMGSSRPVCSVMPNLIGARNLNNVCPTMAPCKGSTYVSGDSFFPPHLHDLDALGKYVPIGRSIGSLVKDPISSNVELRLGQPSQQNQAATLESSILAVSGSHLVVHGHPRKSVFLDQHSHTTTSSRSIDETRQHNHVSGIMSSVCSRTEKTELNDLNHAHGAYMVPHASQLRLLNKNVPGCVGMSESFTNLRSLYEEKNHFESINDLINLSDAIVSKPHSGSSPAKSGQFGFPLLREKVTDTEICTNMLGNQKHEKVEEVRSTIHALRGAAKMNLGTDAKSIERMLSFVEVASDSGCTNYPVLQDKVSNVYQFPGTIPEVPNLRNTLKYCGQVSHPLHSGQHDPNSFRTISSSLELGTNLSSQVHSLGNSATNSISVKAFAASTNSENAHGRPYFLDESSKMRTTGTLKTISGQEKSQNYHGKSQVIIPPMLPGMRKTVFNFSNALNASEVATCPLVSANLTNEEDEKLTSITDKWCNFQVPAVSKGCYSHGKDAEAPDQFHSDLERARQFFIRAGGNGNVASLSEEGNCHQELPNGCFPSKCSFSKKSDCLKGRCDLLSNPSLGEFRDKEGNAVDLVAPFFGHKLSEIYTFAEKNISSGTQSMVQNRKKSDYNAFEWRDVPRKVIEDANEADTKSSEKLVHHALKELESSNLSSGCSAPAVTQASIEANNKDSSTVDGAVTDNFVVDEGSRIEICYSSDDDSEKNAEFDGFPSKLNLVDKQSSKASVSKQSHGFFDELQFSEPLKLRKLQSQTGPSFSIQTDGNVSQNYERKSRRGKRRVVKWKRLDSSVTASALPAAHNGALECGDGSGKLSLPLQNIPMLPQRDQRSFIGSPCSVGKNLKRSKLSSFDAVSRKRGFTPDIEVEKTDSDTNLNAKSDYSEAAEAIKRERLRLAGDTGGLEQNDVLNSTCITSEITAKAAAVDDKATLGKLVNVCHGRRPVVCGKYGIISNANTIKPAKIVSLSRIMKASRRCSFAESTLKESKKAISNNKKELKDGIPSVVSSERNSQSSEGGKEMAYFLVGEDSQDLLHTMKKRRHDGSRSHAIPNSNINSHLRRKCKQIRKRSVNELTLKGINSSCLKPTILKDGKSMLSIKSRFVSDADDGRMYADEKCNDNKHSKDSCQEHWDLGVSCCVCGSSNKDDSNCLLECNSCLIKVHQACYGVSKVPKAQWYCRPCKTSSKNIVCVLCGYGGGALTRALHTRDIVKSLLRTWGIVTESNYENLSLSEPLGQSYKMLPSTKSADESDPFLIIRPAQMEPCSVALCNTDLSEHVHTVDIPSFAPAASVLCNSITAGVFDSTIKQWVHMVCGLWTPGTCCPNVDTMSAFDVSGARQPKHNVVCSICQRSGGTCIQCRVADCGVQFHPWCAHQKGLLQSEVEGIDKQSIGFYGRCMLHEMYQRFDLDSNHTSSADLRERESTCARTEGYKGRKRDGFHDNRGHNSDASTGCLVPQEQLNAWIHIHAQKSCARGPLKLPSSVIDYDCRKEYARYKQSRGWKHLIVYKSGIHGLGLYTSQFISRSAMVVEYVGEIVGLHVADKRETEYQAGKKLQYKSACYFFRIDKEHIIDATRKGGIARFVNHSCTPNCVAKVISVRNEKKVVFFAERDIYPGEEVTYDYHFNHEDEGKKLPCYCKSKNCRRYLN